MIPSSCFILAIRFFFLLFVLLSYVPRKCLRLYFPGSAVSPLYMLLLKTGFFSILMYTEKKPVCHP